MSTNPLLWSLPSVFLLLLAAGCRDLEYDPMTPPSAQVAMASDIPGRSTQRPNTPTDWNTDSLWTAIQNADHKAIVGLKAPNETRGVWRGRVLVSAATLAQAKAATRAIDGIELIKADTLLPRVTLHINNVSALAALRRLPFIDYIEPAVMPTGLPSAWATSPGCGWDGWSSGHQFYGGDICLRDFVEMGFPQAWSRSNGSGVTIGLTDTGLSSTQPEITSDFATGASANRSLTVTGVAGHSGYGSCIIPPCCRSCSTEQRPEHNRRCVGSQSDKVY